MFHLFRSIPVRSYYVRSHYVQHTKCPIKDVPLCPIQSGQFLSENTNKSYPFYLTNDPHRVTLHTGVNDLSHQPNGVSMNYYDIKALADLALTLTALTLPIIAIIITLP